MTPQQFVDFIQSRRFPLTNEKVLQVCIAGELTLAGISAESEVRLSNTDIIDFMIGDIGVEVKIKGQRRAIYLQCERYCQHDRVRSLVLVTNAPMGMPPVINGKPVFMARLGRAWL